MTDLDLNSIKAGDYELVCLSWDQPTSKPGEPYDFVTRRKGDKVTLDVEQARRLVVAGAVKPLGEKAKKDKKKSDDGGDGGTPPPAAPTSVKDILAAVGTDKAKAQEYLDAENAAAQPRSSLVEGLQKVIAAEEA